MKPDHRSSLRAQLEAQNTKFNWFTEAQAKGNKFEIKQPLLYILRASISWCRFVPKILLSKSFPKSIPFRSIVEQPEAISRTCFRSWGIVIFGACKIVASDNQGQSASAAASLMLSSQCFVWTSDGSHGPPKRLDHLLNLMTLFDSRCSTFSAPL